MSFRRFSMHRVIGFALLGFGFAGTPALAMPVVYLPDDVNYTFENLTSGSNLVGQDSWLNYTGTNAAFQVQTGGGSNTTRVVGPGTNTTLVAIRPNNSSYAFPAPSGDMATIQFDFRWDSNVTGTANSYYFGLGAPSTYSSDSTKVSELNERAPAIGVVDNKIFIQRLAGTVQNLWSSTINSTVNTSGDWLRLKLEIDSSGAGHVYYRNLTKAGAGSTNANTAFQRLTPVAGVELHLTSMHPDIQAPSFWNTMALVKNGNIGGTQVDNLMPYVSPYVYNFEHVKNGQLINNDGWRPYNAFGSGLTVEERGTTSFSTYPTKLVNMHGNSDQIVIRPNDDRFSFPAHSESDANAMMQFDFKYVPNTGLYGYYFGLGADSTIDGNDVVSSLNERAPAFGVVNNQFVIRELADGGNSFSDVFTYAITSDEAASGDWIRLRHVMDFTANWNAARSGFDGAGRLFYQNLTRGDAEFYELTTSAVDLRITDMPNDIRNPATWDTMVLVKSGALTGAQITNLIANVPEPASHVLALLGVLGLALSRRQRRRG